MPASTNDNGQDKERKEGRKEERKEGRRRYEQQIGEDVKKTDWIWKTGTYFQGTKKV